VGRIRFVWNDRGRDIDRRVDNKGRAAIELFYTTGSSFGIGNKLVNILSVSIISQAEEMKQNLEKGI